MGTVGKMVYIAEIKKKKNVSSNECINPSVKKAFHPICPVFSAEFLAHEFVWWHVDLIINELGASATSTPR